MTDQDKSADISAEKWLIVEIFGHRQHAGRCFSEERFGVQGIRIDEPLAAFEPEGQTVRWTTHWYAGAAVFSVQETTEAAVMRRAGVKPPPAITPDAGHPLLEGATSGDDDEVCPDCRGHRRDCGASDCPQAEI